MWAVVDGIEGGGAVLLVGEDEGKVDFPKKYLPRGTKEGSVLDLSLGLDIKAEQNRANLLGP